MKKIINGMLSIPPFSYLKDPKKRPMALAFIFFAFTIYFFIGNNLVSAVNYNNKDGIVGAGATMIDQIFNFKTLRFMDKVLGSVSTVVSNATAGLSEGVLEPIGYGFVVLWTMWDILDAAMTSMSSLENFFKKFAWMCVAILIISNAAVFTDNVPKFCIALRDEVNTYIDKDEDTSVMVPAPNNKDKTCTLAESRKYTKQYIKALWNGISDKDLTGQILDGGQAKVAVDLLFMAVSFVLIILVLVLAYIIGGYLFILKAGAMLEMIVRGIFIPIGCSELSRGMQSSGLRYLKKYIATGFQLVVISVTAVVGETVGATITPYIFRAAAGGKLAKIGVTTDQPNLEGFTQYYGSGGLKSSVTCIQNWALGQGSDYVLNPSNAFLILALCILSMVIVYFLIAMTCTKAAQISNDVMGV